MENFLPELPENFRWQLLTEDRRDCTEDYMAEPDAHEARIWKGDDVVLALQRTGDFGYWGPDGVSGEGGLRKWVVQSQTIPRVFAWEQFETLSSVAYRIGVD